MVGCMQISHMHSLSSLSVCFFLRLSHHEPLSTCPIGSHPKCIHRFTSSSGIFNGHSFAEVYGTSTQLPSLDVGLKYLFGATLGLFGLSELFQGSSTGSSNALLVYITFYQRAKTVTCISVLCALPCA